MLRGASGSCRRGLHNPEAEYIIFFLIVLHHGQRLKRFGPVRIRKNFA